MALLTHNPELDYEVHEAEMQEMEDLATASEQNAYGIALEALTNPLIAWECIHQIGGAELCPDEELCGIIDRDDEVTKQFYLLLKNPAAIELHKALAAYMARTYGDAINDY